MGSVEEEDDDDGGGSLWRGRWDQWARQTGQVTLPCLTFEDMQAK